MTARACQRQLFTAPVRDPGTAPRRSSHGASCGPAGSTRPLTPAAPAGLRLDLDGPGRSGYCPPRLSRHPHVLGMVPAIRNRPRPVCPRATDRRDGSNVSGERPRNKGRRADRGAESLRDCRSAGADRWRLGQGRPSAAGSQSVRWEEPCEGTTNPVATRLAACGSGSFWPRAPSARWPLRRRRMRPLRDPGEPLVLSADRVLEWRGAGGQFLYLNGHASALQGTDGLRAARAVCRIVNVSARRRSPLRGGDLRRGRRPPYGTKHGPSAERPCDRVRPLVKMESYERDGINALRSPPTRLDILLRSGFLAAPRPSNPPAPTAAATSAPQLARRLAGAGQEMPVPPSLEAIAATDPSQAPHGPSSTRWSSRRR